MLISNIWGIWPEERSLDDKTSPVSLGPSYACLYTGYWPDCCSLPPTASAPKSLPPHTHSAAYHLPSGSSCLVGMQWHRTVVWISASPQGFGMLTTLSLSFDQLFTFFGKMSIWGLGSIFTRVFTLLLLSSDSSIWNSPVDPFSGLQVSLPKP